MAEDDDPFRVLEDALRVTRLCDVIGRPLDREAYLAVELMRIYGYPRSIDANEIRSFLQDDSRATTGQYIVAITKDAFESLPDVPNPTLWDYVVYERMLLVSILLVLLCLYALMAAPSVPAATTDRI